MKREQDKLKTRSLGEKEDEVEMRVWRAKEGGAEGRKEGLRKKVGKERREERNKKEMKEVRQAVS